MSHEMNCLESLLCEFFNNGKKRQIFSKRVIRDEDGYVKKCFVKGGGEIYEKFVDTIYSLPRTFKTIKDLENFAKSLANVVGDSNMSLDDVVDETDGICNEN